MLRFVCLNLNEKFPYLMESIARESKENLMVFQREKQIEKQKEEIEKHKNEIKRLRGEINEIRSE